MLPNNVKWRSFPKGHLLSSNTLSDLFDKSESDRRALPDVSYAHNNGKKSTLVRLRKREMLFSSEEDAMIVVNLMIEGRFSIP
jgi:hypothetical protein